MVKRPIGYRKMPGSYLRLKLLILFNKSCVLVQACTVDDLCDLWSVCATDRQKECSLISNISKIFLHIPIIKLTLTLGRADLWILPNSLLLNLLEFSKGLRLKWLHYFNLLETFGFSRCNYGIQKIPDDDPLRKDRNRPCRYLNSPKILSLE